MAALHPIRIFRDAKRWSQDQFAKRLGVNRVTVARWECGDRQPSARKLPEITKLTGIPARDLRPDLAKQAAIFSGVAR